MVSLRLHAGFSLGIIVPAVGLADGCLHLHWNMLGHLYERHHDFLGLYGMLYRLRCTVLQMQSLWPHLS